MDLIDFRELYEDSGDFRYLKDPTTKYVAGRGTDRPKVMLLSDAPGATENLEGKSVVGPTGRVLDQLMAVAGLYAVTEGAAQFANNAYVTSMIKYRTGVRGTTAREIADSLSWVRLEWKALRRPPVIVTLGVDAMRCLLGMHIKMSDAVGNPHPIAAGGPTIWPMLHPRYPMNNPQMRPACEEHWERLGAWLQEEGLL